MDESGEVIARFKNKKHSSLEVGSFEVYGSEGDGEGDGGVDDGLVDEILISGLATVMMVQSVGLGTMVIFGGA